MPAARTAYAARLVKWKAWAQSSVAILAGSFWHLRTGGSFYQFTYGPRCPVPRPIPDRLGLKASFVGKTMQNVPPAAVYRIVHRPPFSAPAPLAASDDGKTG
ncbi:hypothetical protein [Beijerinckia indica]|uniref:Uncharacterized protein n=1 Tax=Beijerinckia indica subsp. indica (strain ATCC 9039 / DSM 1715 / NCIMB 8712) TaxID=395963 RepID=B2IAZ8_BEII9|nr:hypothetical protein Bind_0039 [Beijerinckia indica subsp. indica ATCC 9039]